MSSKKNLFITSALILAVSLIASSVTAYLVSYYYSRFSFQLLNAVCSKVVKREPETIQALSAALKAYTKEKQDGLSDYGVLSQLGYHASDFFDLPYRQIYGFVIIGFLTGMLLFLFTFLYRNKAENKRIKALTGYLEQINSGKALILSALGEDDFSKLEDEIYKTVTFLYQTKDQAVRAKNGFAENLSNIAHQIKTPLTALSLSVQKMKLCYDRESLKQLEKQVSRLTHLQEALLILSRLDAGILFLQKEEVDVYTLLVLAADNLQELFSGFGALIEIPEAGKMPVMADKDWTMEAIMNLMKNCIGNVFSNTLGFVRQRRREFARYMSIGLPPGELKKLFCIEAFTIAARPFLISFPVVILLVGVMMRASYMDVSAFLAEAPYIPVFLFILGISGSVALAYYLAWRNVKKISLAEVCRNDTML